MGIVDEQPASELEAEAPEADPLEAAIAAAEAQLDADERDEDAADELDAEQTNEGELEGEAEAAEAAEDESDEGEESEGEEDEDDVPEGYVVLGVPESLQEQGMMEIEVPAEHDQLFRSLTNSYESKAAREAKEQEVKEYESGLMEELEDFRLMVATNPFSIVDKTFKEPEAADDAFQLWLIQDSSRLKRFRSWVDRLDGADAISTAKDKLDLSHRKRVADAKDTLRDVQAGREAARVVVARIGELIEQIAPEDRDFVRQHLHDGVRGAAQEQHFRTGSDIIGVDVVDRVASPWLTRFGLKAKPKPKPSGRTQKARVDDAQQRMRIASKRRRDAKKVAPSSGQPSDGGFKSPAGGRMLDDVIKDLKSGKAG